MIFLEFKILIRSIFSEFSKMAGTSKSEEKYLPETSECCESDESADDIPVLVLYQKPLNCNKMKT